MTGLGLSLDETHNWMLKKLLSIKYNIPVTHVTKEIIERYYKERNE